MLGSNIRPDLSLWDCDELKDNVGIPEDVDGSYVAIGLGKSVFRMVMISVADNIKKSAGEL